MFKITLQRLINAECLVKCINICRRRANTGTFSRRFLPDFYYLQATQSYYFARDLRVYGAFQDRLETHKNEIKRLINKRLKWQLRVLSAVIEGRSITFRVCLVLMTAYGALTV